MKNKIYKAIQPGYTLIEMMVVISIIVIMASLAMSSMIRSSDQQIFNNQFGKIFSLISNARSLAITGKGQLDYVDFDNDGKSMSINPPKEDYVTPANYGVHFENSKIVMFADMNPPLVDATGSKGKYNDGSDYAKGDDLKLGDAINLGNEYCLKLQTTTTPKTYDSGSIFFSPNYADISTENFDFETDNFLKIRLHDKTAVKRCRQITIHKLAGIPEVEQCDTAGQNEVCS